MSDSSPSSGPDFTKVGFGAMGNVEVKHDASTTHNTTNDASSTSHTHHDDKSQHSHVHYHGTPPPSSGAGTSRPSFPIAIVLGLVALTCLAFFLVFKDHKTTSAPTAGTSAASPVPIITTQGTLAITGVLQLQLNRSSYRVNDLMEITVTSQQEGYLYVLAVWADGRVDTLFPNSQRPNPKIATGTRIILPNDFPPTADGQVLRYPMSMPALPGNPASATESIVAVLSPTPMSLPQSTELASMPGFAAVGMLNDPDFRTRGPQPKFMKLQKGPVLDFGGLPQAAVHYDVHR